MDRYTVQIHGVEHTLEMTAEDADRWPDAKKVAKRTSTSKTDKGGDPDGSGVPGPAASKAS